MRSHGFALLMSLAAIGCGGSSTNADAALPDQAAAIDSATPADATSSVDALTTADATSPDDLKTVSTGDGGIGAACTASGGTVGMSLCCGTATDFPNTCAIGACGCAPGSSHMVATCACPTGKCFDGSSCVTTH